MKLLKERPQITFIIFILLLFTLFTATILLFHTTVSETVKKEQGVSSELAETNAKLNRTQDILHEIQSELNKSKNDIKTFDSLYTETNTELEKTAITLDVTSSKLKTAEDLVKTQITQIVDLSNKNNELTGKILDDNQTITDLTKDLARLQDRLDDVCKLVATPPSECE